MMVSNMLINLIFSTGQAENEQAVQSMISALPWAMLIDAGLLAPFTEEIVFRKSFRNVFGKGKLFVLLSGLVFGGLHVISATNPIGYLYIISSCSLKITLPLLHIK